MSTRCNIIIHSETEHKSCFLYHHWDGYPEGVGKELVDRLSGKFAGFDSIKSTLQQDSQYEDTNGLHADIEYLYVILVDTLNLNIFCFKAKNWEGDRFGNPFEGGKGLWTFFVTDMMDREYTDSVLNGKARVLRDAPFNVVEFINTKVRPNLTEEG